MRHAKIVSIVQATLVYRVTSVVVQWFIFGQDIWNTLSSGHVDDDAELFGWMAEHGFSRALEK